MRPQGPSIGEDVIGRKGVYGRLAERWFSKRGWTADHRRAEGMSSDEGGDTTAVNASLPEEGVDTRSLDSKPAPNAPGGDGVGEIAEEVVKEDVAHNLMPKLLNTTRLLLGSRSLFFSYDWDITRAWSTRRHSADSSLPLHKLVDPLVFFLSDILIINIDKIQVHFLTFMTVLLEPPSPKTLY